MEQRCLPNESLEASWSVFVSWEPLGVPLDSFQALLAALGSNRSPIGPDFLDSRVPMGGDLELLGRRSFSLGVAPPLGAPKRLPNGSQK